MAKWATIIKAIDTVSGELCEWCGPVIDAPSLKLAIEFCQGNGLGYCQITGKLVLEVPLKNGLPDWDHSFDFEIICKN